MVSLWQVEVNVVGSDVVVRPILRSAGNPIGVQGDGLLTICQKSDTKKIAAADRRWKAWCDRENRERVRVFLEGEGECLSCGGKHPPDSEDAWVEFEGYIFRPPFLCMCCGKQTCARQWAYGRCCARCDTGACKSENSWKDHGAPSRRVPSHHRMWSNLEAFAREVGAVKAVIPIPLEALDETLAAC